MHNNIGIVIGIIDSGVGGLSVLKEIHSLLPNHSLAYIGDSAWCPYGSKSFDDIQKRVFALSDYLIYLGAELIVVACNSATIAAVEALRVNYPVPFVGMEPGVKPAAAITQTHTIGVLATEASLSGEKFHRLVSTHAFDLRVITQPCPKFVELVEQGILDGPEVDAAIREYTAHMLAEGADTLILGCTHYPFLKPAIEALLPAHIKIIDTGHAVAKQVAKQSPRPADHPQIQILTTGPLKQLNLILPKLCPEIAAKCETAHL
ncbi:MAG: glutamate racemase [Verrucomicrobiaceae bacterium]